MMIGIDSLQFVEKHMRSTLYCLKTSSHPLLETSKGHLSRPTLTERLIFLSDVSDGAVLFHRRKQGTDLYHNVHNVKRR